MKDMVKTKCRDLSARKLGLQDLYERNQGLETQFHIKQRGFYAKRNEKDL
jgi:hypothetical protein